MADDKLLQAAKNNLDKLGTELGKKIGAVVSETNVEKIITALDSSSALSDLKSTIKTTVLKGKSMFIPSTVYEKMADSVYEKILNIADEEDYSTDDDTLTKQILGEINSAFGKIPDTTVTATITDDDDNSREVTYTIEFDLSFTLKGVGVTAVTVSDGENTSKLLLTTGGKKKSRSILRGVVSAQTRTFKRNLAKSLQRLRQKSRQPVQRALFCRRNQQRLEKSFGQLALQKNQQSRHQIEG